MNASIAADNVIRLPELDRREITRRFRSQLHCDIQDGLASIYISCNRRADSVDVSLALRTTGQDIPYRFQADVPPDGDKHHITAVDGPDVLSIRIRQQQDGTYRINVLDQAFLDHPFWYTLALSACLRDGQTIPMTADPL